MTLVGGDNVGVGPTLGPRERIIFQNLSRGQRVHAKLGRAGFYSAQERYRKINAPAIDVYWGIGITLAKKNAATGRIHKENLRHIRCLREAVDKAILHGVPK